MRIISHLKRGFHQSQGSRFKLTSETVQSIFVAHCLFMIADEFSNDYSAFAKLLHNIVALIQQR